MNGEGPDQEQFYHTPVLLREVLEFLVTSKAGIYVDATLGGGGHAEALLTMLEPGGRLIGIDADEEALASARRKLSRFGDRIILLHDNFRNLYSILRDQNLTAVDGVLLDLGVSSFQLDERTRGFSFRSDERLDMRMDRRQRLDAHEVVNRYPQEKLADLLWNYGEEKHARRIARRIVEHRARCQINTTMELAEIVRAVVGGRNLTKSLARVFQAIRIEVNDELTNLRRAISDAIGLLAAGGRVVVIAYHSLEDRIVKESFKHAAATSRPSGTKLLPDRPVAPLVRILTKKPLEASAEERRNNPRARSARLRAAERLNPSNHDT